MFDWLPSVLHKATSPRPHAVLYASPPCVSEGGGALAEPPVRCALVSTVVDGARVNSYAAESQRVAIMGFLWV